MWKPERRATADRRGLRYESDLTDAEGALVAPLIRPAKRGGRPRTVNVREVLNAIFYVLGMTSRVPHQVGQSNRYYLLHAGSFPRNSGLDQEFVPAPKSG